MLHLSICKELVQIEDDSQLSLNEMAYRRCLECQDVASGTEGSEKEGGGATGGSKRTKYSIDIAGPARNAVDDSR